MSICVCERVSECVRVCLRLCDYLDVCVGKGINNMDAVCGAKVPKETRCDMIVMQYYSVCIYQCQNGC